jgi:sugar phosphate isomerase/epimerase
VRLGFVSAILPDFSLDQVVSTAQQLQFDCVELMCWPPGGADRRYAGVTHIDVTSLSDTDAAQIRGQFSNANLAISGLGYYPNPLSPDPSEAERACEHLRKVIGACHKLQVRQCNTFVGRDWRRSVEDNWPRFIETWSPLITFAEQQDVRIGIENCPMLFSADEWPGGKNLATSPAIWRRMFQAIPSPYFGLNYDPSHLVWQQMDPVAPIEEFAKRIFHVHAKDVRVDRQRLNQVGTMAYPSEYHVPKLPGLGDVNWGRFFSMLTDCGYSGAVCVEVEDRAYEGTLEGRLTSLRQSLTYLRNFVPKPV